MIVGETTSLEATGYDIYLLETDGEGNKVWVKTYGGEGNDYGNWVTQVSESCQHCYLIAGASFHDDRGSAYVVKACSAVPPAAPTIIDLPKSRRTGESFSVTWEDVLGAETYVLQEGTDPAFLSSEAVYNGSDTRITFTKNLEGTYYYRVRAQGRGLWSEWSTHGSIEILLLPQPPGSPIIKSLPTGVEIGKDYEISWTEVPEAEGYIVQEDTDPSFPGNRTIYTGMDTHVTLTKGSPGTYYYRVRAAKDFLWSEWSQYESIQIQPIVVPPQRNWTDLLLITLAVVVCLLTATLLAMTRKRTGRKTKERRAS